MSTTLSSSVRIPSISRYWPRIRRLLVLACIAAIGAAIVTASSAPHRLAVAVDHVQHWMAGLSALDVFLGLVGLFVVAIVVAVRTAIDLEEHREWFDVR